MKTISPTSATAKPGRVSQVLTDLAAELDKILPDGPRRDGFLALVGLTPGTAGDGLDETRCYMVLDWFVRVWLPAWLDTVPTCGPDAARVRQLDAIVHPQSATRAEPVVRRAWEQAEAAWVHDGNADRRTPLTTLHGLLDSGADMAEAVISNGRHAGGVSAWDTVGAGASAAAWAAAATARIPLLPTIESLQCAAVELFGGLIEPTRSNQ